jgi:AcrR family transcriptional regulator
LLEERGYHGVGLETLAAEAGMSRQSIYVHFRSKARLLLELVDYVDESEGVPTLTDRIETAASGEEALDLFIDLVARVAPRIFRVVAALDAARSEDAIAATAWRDRADRRRRRCRNIVGRLAEEGRLAPELDVATAADLLWTLASVRVWEDLVVTRRWASDRYRAHMRRTLRSALLSQG